MCHKPFFTPELKALDRKRKRIYARQGRSSKWRRTNTLFKRKLISAKRHYYQKFIKDIKTSNPGQWYSKLKRITAHDQHISNEINVNEISHLSDQAQADFLANQFSSISLEYEKLKTEDIIIPPFDEKDIPYLSPKDVLPYLKSIKLNKSSVKGDIPARIIKDFAQYICYPFADILNSMIIRGEYPNLWKMEIQTPIPKVYPPTKTSELRNISRLGKVPKTH